MVSLIFAAIGVIVLYWMKERDFLIMFIALLSLGSFYNSGETHKHTHDILEHIGGEISE